MRIKIAFIALILVATAGLFAGYELGKPQPTTFLDFSVHHNLGFHQSYFTQVEFYDKAFQTASLTPQQPNPDVTAVVVNHHLLAPAFIAETLNVVASDQSTTVILVSPNHFDAGSGDILSSLYDWQTPYGVLPAEQKVIAALSESGVKIEEKPFNKEHGISGIVPFIKKTMPNASVVPLIFKDRTSQSELDKVLTGIEQNTTGRVIMVTSVDFSHYLPSAASDFHDVLSEHVLKQLDQNEVGRLEIDSKPAISLLLSYVQARGTEKFTVLNHSNAATVSGDKNLMVGTSYITGYFSPGPRTSDDHKTLLVTGDINFSDGLVAASNPKDPKYLFTSTQRLFTGSTQTYTELKGTNNQAVEKNLALIGINNSSQAFNVIEVNGAQDRVDQIIQQISSASKPTIVSIEWPQGTQKAKQQLARRLLDAGAIAVLGHGADIGPAEYYHNKLIVYSMGNLIPSNLQDSSLSLSVGIDSDHEQTKYSLFALQYKNGQVNFIAPGDNGIIPVALRQQIYGQ